MEPFSNLGKLLMAGGVLLFAVGVLIALGGKIPFLGRLPGDIFFQRKGFGFSFPVATCIVVSLLLMLILNLISRR